MSTIIDTLEIVIWIVTIPALIIVMIGTVILLAKPRVFRLVKHSIDNFSVSGPILFITSLLLLHIILLIISKPTLYASNLTEDEQHYTDFYALEVDSPDYLEAEQVTTNGGLDPIRGIFRDSCKNRYYLELSSSVSTIKEIEEIKNSQVSIPVKAVYEGKDFYINNIFLNISENEIIKHLKIPSSVDFVILEISSCDSLETISFRNISETHTCHISLYINDCENLKSISFPECETVIDSLSIQSCPSLEKIDAPGLSTIENVLFEPNSTKDIIVNSDNELIKEVLHE